MLEERIRELTARFPDLTRIMEELNLTQIVEEGTATILTRFREVILFILSFCVFC